MEVLKEMFPQHDEEALRAALASAEGDLEMASALLLSADSAPRPHINPVAMPPANHDLPPMGKKRRFEDDWSKSPVRALSNKLAKRLEDSRLADVALKCLDGEIVLAHKLVLSTRNQYLGVLLMTLGEGVQIEDLGAGALDAAGSPQGDCGLPTLELEMSAKTCRRILRYLYTDHLGEHLSEEEVPYLHEAASFLDIEFIRRKCEGSDKLPESTFASDFLTLLHDPDHVLSDLELESGDGSKVFYVHRLVMACGSDYFEEMLRGGFKERVERRIVMRELSGDELEMMVESVYSDGRVRRGKMDEKNCFSFFLKSNQFLFSSLQSYAESVMCKYLDDDNVMDLLNDDVVRLSPALKQHCLDYVAKHFERMERTASYQALPSLVKLEVEHFAAKQNEEMFMALIATLTDAKKGSPNEIQSSITDFNTLVREEIVEFLESQLARIEIPAVTESITQQIVTEDGEVIPTRFRFKLEGITLHSAPSLDEGPRKESKLKRGAVWLEGNALFDVPPRQANMARQMDDREVLDDGSGSDTNEEEEYLSESSSDTGSEESTLELPKDSISAVFTPTKLSILAKDISLQIKYAAFSFDAFKERFSDFQSDASSAFPEDVFSGSTSDTEFSDEDVPISGNRERLDQGAMDVLLSGVSFALSFAFSAEQNMALLQKLAQASVRESKKKKKRPSPFGEGFHLREETDSSSSLSSSSASDSDGEDSSLDDFDVGAVEEVEQPKKKSLLSLHNFSCDIEHLQFKVYHASRYLRMKPRRGQITRKQQQHDERMFEKGRMLSALFATHFGPSLRQDLLAAFQSNISDSLAHLTEQLNAMGAKQLSRLSSFPLHR